MKSRVLQRNKTRMRYLRKYKNSRKYNSKTRKGGKKTATFKKAQCAPKTGADDELQKYSCYSEKDLIKMKDLWNARHRDMPISDSIPRDIWQSLKTKMENACHTEACWLKQKFMENNLNNEELSTYTFAPKSPEKWKENHNTWLNSSDIEKVMKQYEHTYPCFRFIGPTPIDFDTHLYDKQCVWEELCNFDLNSNGTRMPKEIKAFCERVIKQARFVGLELTLDQNAPFSHQEGNTECGMYSLYLIITLLKERHNYNFFKTTRISDKAMENMRDRYYNSDL
jgi:hypothetical protein